MNADWGQWGWQWAKMATGTIRKRHAILVNIVSTVYWLTILIFSGRSSYWVNWMRWILLNSFKLSSEFRKFSLWNVISAVRESCIRCSTDSSRHVLNFCYYVWPVIYVPDVGSAAVGAHAPTLRGEFWKACVAYMVHFHCSNERLAIDTYWFILVMQNCALKARDWNIAPTIKQKWIYTIAIFKQM